MEETRADEEEVFAIKCMTEDEEGFSGPPGVLRGGEHAKTKSGVEKCIANARLSPPPSMATTAAAFS